jgi:hypothetical protein
MGQTSNRPWGRPHPSTDISLDGLAGTTHRSVPSSPLVVKVVGIERRQLSWQRGLPSICRSGIERTMSSNTAMHQSRRH